jgi:hypothetical protein
MIRRTGTSRRGVTEVPQDMLVPLHPVPRPGKPPNYIPALAASIRANGYDIGRAVPAVRMPDGRVVQLGGHHRAAAMRQLGEATIPARLAEWSALSEAARARWRQLFPNFPWDEIDP